MSSLRIPWTFLGSSLWVPLSSPRVPPQVTRSFLLELLKWITWLPWIDSIQVDITSSADNEQLVESLQINQGRWWVVWCWKIKNTVRSQAVKTKFTGSALQASQLIKPYIIRDINKTFFWQILTCISFIWHFIISRFTFLVEISGLSLNSFWLRFPA